MSPAKQIKELEKNGTWEWLWEEMDKRMYEQWKKGQPNQQLCDALKEFKTHIMVICGDIRE